MSNNKRFFPNVEIDNNNVYYEMTSKFVASIRCDELDFFMKFITSFGNTTTIIILLSLVLWLFVIKKN